MSERMARQIRKSGYRNHTMLNLPSKINAMIRGEKEPRLRTITVRSLKMPITWKEGNTWRSEKWFAACLRCEGHGILQDDWAINSKYHQDGEKWCFACDGKGKFVLPHPNNYIYFWDRWSYWMEKQGREDEVCRVLDSEIAYITSLDPSDHPWEYQILDYLRTDVMYRKHIISEEILMAWYLKVIKFQEGDGWAEVEQKKRQSARRLYEGSARDTEDDQEDFMREDLEKYPEYTSMPFEKFTVPESGFYPERKQPVSERWDEDGEPSAQPKRRPPAISDDQYWESLRATNTRENMYDFPHVPEDEPAWDYPEPQEGVPMDPPVWETYEDMLKDHPAASKAQTAAKDGQAAAPTTNPPPSAPKAKPRMYMPNVFLLVQLLLD